MVLMILSMEQDVVEHAESNVQQPSLATYSAAGATLQ
jgi:hypothetical protein